MRINSPATRKFAYLRAFSGTRIARLSDARKGRDMAYPPSIFRSLPPFWLASLPPFS